MGASKNFYTELQEGEQYANISVRIDLLNEIKKSEMLEELDYTINHIKQINSKHKEDELLCVLYKQKAKLNKDIIKLEQDLNHR